MEEREHAVRQRDHLRRLREVVVVAVVVGLPCLIHGARMHNRRFLKVPVEVEVVEANDSLSA